MKIIHLKLRSERNMVTASHSFPDPFISVVPILLLSLPLPKNVLKTRKRCYKMILTIQRESTLQKLVHLNNWTIIYREGRELILD